MTPDYKAMTWVQMHDGKPVVHHRGGGPNEPTTPAQSSDVISRLLNNDFVKIGAAVAGGLLAARYLRAAPGTAGMFFGGATTKKLAEAGRNAPDQAMQIATRMHARGANETAIWNRTGRFLARKKDSDFAAVTVDSKGRPMIELTDQKMKFKASAATPADVVGGFRREAEKNKTLDAGTIAWIGRLERFGDKTLAEVKVLARTDPDAKRIANIITKSVTSGPAHRFIDHPAMMRVSPTALDVPILFSKALPKGNAQYVPHVPPHLTESITVGGSRFMPTSKPMRSDTMHEVQHRVAHMDGLEKGSNMGNSVVYGDQSQKHILKIFERAAARVSKLYPEEAARLANVKRLTTLEEVSLGSAAATNARIAAATDLISTRPGYMLTALHAVKQHHTENRINDTAWVNRKKYVQYFNVEGERLARNVQTRIDLSLAQRRATPPERTVDPLASSRSWSGRMAPKHLPKTRPE
jgi:hypothetical protein